ncbi:hypothetical protein Tco_1353424 [Tanacetum coccineum]
MSDQKFTDTHNLVAFLEKPTKSEGFEEIVDFLNAKPIKYDLTINPTIYCSCIKQFWDTVKAKTVNGEVQLQALVDKKEVIITKSTIRRDLQLEDANGVDFLPNAAIFEQLTLMGTMSSPNRSTSDIEDAFSSMNILNYTSVSSDYFPVSLGSNSFNSSENSNDNMIPPIFYLKDELKKIHTQIIELQNKQLWQKDKIAFAYYRISNLEQIIEKIQARHQTNQEDL